MHKFALVGFAIGIAWPTIFLVFQYETPSLVARIMQLPGAEAILIFLWPSSLVLMAAQADSMAIPIIALLTNGVLYSVVGVALWVLFGTRPMNGPPHA